jgi:hypothetical protein
VGVVPPTLLLVLIGNISLSSLDFDRTYSGTDRKQFTARASACFQRHVIEGITLSQRWVPSIEKSSAGREVVAAGCFDYKYFCATV